MAATKDEIIANMRQALTDIIIYCREINENGTSSGTKIAGIYWAATDALAWPNDSSALPLDAHDPGNGGEGDDGLLGAHLGDE